jgi:CPA2 family monovalent cation:H+ antiporter-2
MQDLMVVPLLFLENLPQHPDQPGILKALLMALLRSVLAVAGIVVLGRLIVRPLFRLVAGTHSSELFLALTLLAILGLAWATGALGLQGALGAFLAGLLVAETEFRPQVAGDIRPFRGLLLGLFFISVGMSIDLSTIFERAHWVILAVCGLIVIKGAMIAFLARLAGRSAREAIRTGILLGQAGEFAFIVIGAAMTTGLMKPELGQFMTVTVGLSLLATPFLPRLADIVCAMLPIPQEDGALPLPEIELDHHVVIAGFGRVGQTVARLLAQQQITYIGLDTDAETVRRMRNLGEPVFFGDAAQYHVLERMSGNRALAVAITMDDALATALMVREIRTLWPNLPVYARAHDIAGAYELVRLGATGAVPETEESSLQLGGQVLAAIGFPADAVASSLAQARRDMERAESEAPTLAGPRQA